jgi:hypothetical protein
MSTLKIESPVVLSGEEAARTIRQLNERVEQLERQVAFERRQTEEGGVADAVPAVIKYLRMHGIVLLNAGHERAEDVREQVGRGGQAAVAALGEAWSLANAPLPQSTIEQVRAAINGGKCRW